MGACSSFDPGVECIVGGSGSVLFETDQRTGPPELSGQHAVMIALDDREFHFLCTVEPDAGVSCPPEFPLVEGDMYASATIGSNLVENSFTYPNLDAPPKKIHAVVFAGAEPSGRTVGQVVFEPTFSHDETLSGEVCEIAEGPDDQYPLTP